MARIPLWDYARFTDRGGSHHQAFWNALDATLTPDQVASISPGGALRSIWESAAPAAPATPAVAAAIPLIRQFEGCRLTAYPDPETGAEPWTIGWGSTTDASGAPFRPGHTITQAEADALLLARAQRDHAQLAQRIPTWSRLSANQQAALLSFTYNCGPTWYGSAGFSTLTSLLQRGDLIQVPAALALYVNPGGPSEAGLRRRRAAEAALWSTGSRTTPSTAITNPLPVPFFPQQDNGPNGWRQCQTSSIAMCLAYLKITGIRDDLDYLPIVQRHGDTTSQDSHRKALAELGVRARFRQNMTTGDLLAELKAGLPVAIGILHHGPVSKPTGGGHYITAIGFTDAAWIVHDPYGELNLVDGGWSSQSLNAGRSQRYSFRNLNPRWLPEGPASGWGWVFS